MCRAKIFDIFLPLLINYNVRTNRQEKEKEKKYKNYVNQKNIIWHQRVMSLNVKNYIFILQYLWNYLNHHADC